MSAFAFTVPEGTEPGMVMKVPALDGVMLHVSLPGNLLAGDKLFMDRDEQGQWSISRAERKAPPGGAAAAPAGAARWRPVEQLEAELASPESVRVRVMTTKGPIDVCIVPSWAPKGAERFLRLVDEGFFQDIAIYRCIPGFLVQFGVVQAGDSRSGRYQPIEDDPLVQVPFEEGSVTFAAAGPGTRKHTLCLFLGDCRSQLGSNQPETPIGRVCKECLPTLHSLHVGYGDIPQCGGKGPDPGQLEARGNEYIRSEFPACDFITAASRVP